MAKVSYDRSGSYRRESKSSTRSYTNREYEEERVQIDYGDHSKKYEEYRNRPRYNEFDDRTNFKELHERAKNEEFDGREKYREFEGRASTYKEEFNERAKYKEDFEDRPAAHYKEFNSGAQFNDIALEERRYSREYRPDKARRESRESYRREEKHFTSSVRKQESFNSQREDLRLIQPGRSYRPSVETESVLTDSSRIPMGLEVLQTVDTFKIRQTIESEAWWDVANFTVEDGRGRQVLEIRQEEANSTCLQAILGKVRQYYMRVYAGKEWIMELDHPFSCLSPIFCPWSSPAFTVRMTTGEVLGQARSAARETCATCLPPTKYFEIVSHDGTIINAVTGPTCYPFECKDDDVASFELYKMEVNGNSSRVGRINHEYRGCCGGAFSCCVTDKQEAVTITFPKDSPVEEKALYLGLGLLALYTFFEVK